MTARYSRSILRAGLGATLAIGLAGCAGGGLFGGGDDEDVTPTVGNRIPILSRIETGAQVDPALAGVPVTLPAARANTEWAQPGGSANKAYGHVQLADQPVRVWSANITGGTNRERLGAPPVVGAGKLFAVDSGGATYAFDAATGARLWSQKATMDDDMRPSAFGGGVSYDNGRLYVTNGGGEVSALNPDNGAEIWKVKPAGPLRGAPTVAFGSIFVMTQDNQIHALDAATGEQQWQEVASATQAGVFGVAAPAAGQGTVIAGYSSGELVAYRYENGRSLWSDALARTNISTQVGSLTDIDADPIILDGRVYALGQGGRMAAYELLTGQRIWELNLAGISTPAIAGDWIFTLTDDARLLAIARATGKVRWLTQMPRYRDEEDREGAIYWQGPVLAGNNLWMVNSQGEIYKVSTGEGAATLFTDLDEQVSLAPIVANGTLYVLDNSGRISAFR